MLHTILSTLVWCEYVILNCDFRRYTSSVWWSQEASALTSSHECGAQQHVGLGRGRLRTSANILQIPGQFLQKLRCKVAWKYLWRMVLLIFNYFNHIHHRPSSSAVPNLSVTGRSYSTTDLNKFVHPCIPCHMISISLKYLTNFILRSERINSRSKYSGRQNIYTTQPSSGHEEAAGGLHPSYSYGSRRSSAAGLNNNSSGSRPMSSSQTRERVTEASTNRPFSSRSSVNVDGRYNNDGTKTIFPEQKVIIQLWGFVS